jgi:MFS family permease
MSDRTEVKQKLPVIALCIIALVYILYAWDRLVVPIELVDLRSVYGFSMSIAGLLGSVFTLGLALMAIPAGIIVMRFGTRATLVGGAILFSLCVAYPAVGFTAVDLVIVQVLSGAGEGLYNVALYSFLGRLTEKYRGTATGLAASLFGVGLFLARLSVSAIVGATGSWRSPFFIFAIAGLVGAWGIALALRKGSSIESTEPRAPMTRERLRRVLVPRNIAVCGVMIVAGLAIYSFLGVFTTYLRTVQHMDLAGAARIFSLEGFGSIVGGMPCGYVADMVGRKRYLVAAAIVAGIAGPAAFVAPPIPLLLGAICFTFGAATNSIYANCYALIQDQVKKEEIPLATGLLATIYFLMAAFSGYLLVAAESALGWAMAGVVIYAIPCAAAVLVILGLIYTERTPPTAAAPGASAGGARMR